MPRSKSTTREITKNLREVLPENCTVMVLNASPNGEGKLLQRKDGTVFKKVGENWFYLSPLFAEWIVCDFQSSDLQPYPRNLNVAAEVLEVAVK